MTKKMLIDCTHEEETRVVVIDNNKLQDVEFETINKRPIKGNVYLAKVMRVEPSLQACFVDYGGNRHGFLAYGEIHSDYYNVSNEVKDAMLKEIEQSLEAKKSRNNAKHSEEINTKKQPVAKQEVVINGFDVIEIKVYPDDYSSDLKKSKAEKPKKKKFVRRRPNKKSKSEVTCATGFDEDTIKEEVKLPHLDYDDDDIEDDEDNNNEDTLKNLMLSKKLFYNNKIQDVISEGQILLVQVVKEERGNKGAALTTYLSLAGRYCVLMPNRIKSGGVSRKITNQADRKRLKGIVSELPLNCDMSLIVRTAGEEKTKQDITRDYNYLIRSWNKIRETSLCNQAPAMIHEEGNLIKRALRDIYSKEISEVVVDGYQGYKIAKDFFKILAPHNLKKIKIYKNTEIPMFQRYQVEGQLDKLHDHVAQLESGGYIVIDPTEALVSIDVNSGRATKEKDLEETALKTNLEACDEIAKQLRVRNLAGLVVVDFIDMAENKNNIAVEKRMKEALKKDRSKIQVGKMSMFGLLELSRQRMNSSFFESTYRVCPHCQGKGIIRSIQSSAMMILRVIEEEGSKNRSSRLNIWVPTEIALYLLNANRQRISEIEEKYNFNVCILADDSILNVADYRTEKIKMQKADVLTKPEPEYEPEPENKPEVLPEPKTTKKTKKIDKTEKFSEEVKETEKTEKNVKRKNNWWQKLVKG